MAIKTSEKRKARVRKRVEVPSSVMARGLERANDVQRSIEYLVVEGRVPVVDIAAGLGVSRREVWAWKSKRFQPQQPVHCFVLIEWAEHIRSSRAYTRLLEAALAASRAQAKEATMNAREEGK